MRMDKENLKCPVCKEQLDVNKCAFARVIKSEEGEDMLYCCPTQAKFIKNE